MRRFETLAASHPARAAVLAGLVAGVVGAGVGAVARQPVATSAVTAFVVVTGCLIALYRARAGADRILSGPPERLEDVRPAGDPSDPRSDARPGTARRLRDAFTGRVGPYRDDEADRERRAGDDPSPPDLDIWRLDR